MDENKNEQEIIEILGTFEQEAKIKNEGSKTEIQSVKYYENFAIKGMKEFEIKGVFVTEEIDNNGERSYHVYYKDPSNEILSIDSEGNIQINQDWRKVIGDIDFAKSMEINDKEPERLKGISEKATSKDVLKKLKQEETEQDEKEEKAEEQIQKDIGGEEDLEISYYRPIKDNSFEKQIGMNLSGYQEIGLAYSKTKEAFIFVRKKDGQFQQVEGFELAQPTFKTVMSIDEKGHKIEKKIPHALMETNNPEKELSITIGQYGYIEVGTIDRLTCDERVERQAGEQYEGDEGRTNIELNRVIEEEGAEGLRNYIKKHEESNEDMKVGEARTEDVAEEIANADNERDGEDYIPNTGVKWKEFARACGYRGEGAIKHAQDVWDEEKTKPKNHDKTNEDLVNEIIQDKEDEFRETKQRK